MVGATSVSYTGEALSFTWLDHGFRLHIPEDALPSSVTDCSIQFKSALSGSFTLPDNAELVSGIYSIHNSQEFTKMATIEIQHFSTTDTMKEIEELCFIISNGDQLPYQFTYCDNGIFSMHNQYGAIKVRHFSKYGVARRKKQTRVAPYKKSSTSHNLYRAHVLYMMKESPSNWDVVFCITQQAELCSKV